MDQSQIRSKLKMQMMISVLVLSCVCVCVCEREHAMMINRPGMNQVNYWLLLYIYQWNSSIIIIIILFVSSSFRNKITLTLFRLMHIETHTHIN